MKHESVETHTFASEDNDVDVVVDLKGNRVASQVTIRLRGSGRTPMKVSLKELAALVEVLPGVQSTLQERGVLIPGVPPWSEGAIVDYNEESQ